MDGRNAPLLLLCNCCRGFLGYNKMATAMGPSISQAPASFLLSQSSWKIFTGWMSMDVSCSICTFFSEYKSLLFLSNVFVLMFDWPHCVFRGRSTCILHCVSRTSGHFLDWRDINSNILYWYSSCGCDRLNAGHDLGMLPSSYIYSILDFSLYTNAWVNV